MHKCFHIVITMYTVMVVFGNTAGHGECITFYIVIKASELVLKSCSTVTIIPVFCLS